MGADVVSSPRLPGNRGVWDVWVNYAAPCTGLQACCVCTTTTHRIELNAPHTLRPGRAPSISLLTHLRPARLRPQLRWPRIPIARRRPSTEKRRHRSSQCAAAASVPSRPHHQARSGDGRAVISHHGLKNNTPPRLEQGRTLTNADSHHRPPLRVRLVSSEIASRVRLRIRSGAWTRSRHAALHLHPGRVAVCTTLPKSARHL